MHNTGQSLIWLGLGAIVTSSVFYAILSFRKDNPKVRNIARLSFAVFAILTTITSALLMHLILNHEFLYSYVTRYSSRNLPLEYLISSFWAGQEGSFLLWILFGAWLGIAIIFRAKDMEPQVMLIYNLNILFLTIILLKQSPFHMLPIPPSDGQGLNMLLQDPWMVIHPPIVFLGYAAFAIHFSYAIAGLWRREYDAWIRPALPWTAFAFVTLGAGIIIGGYWSYKVLGWGGYWAWDPVENASLLPWLAITALMHGMILQQTQKRLRKTNFVLAVFSFLLIIYCTFLTRSGILADFSVHSFVDLGITGWLVFFMFAFIAISVSFILVRAKDIPTPTGNNPTNYFSREFGFVVAIAILCLCTLFTGLGTSAPLITRLFEKASKVSTEFYVQTNLPLAMVMLVLLSFVPLMTWGNNNLSRLGPRLVWSLVGAITSSTIALINGYPGFAILLLSFFAGGAVGVNILLTVKLMKKRFLMSSGAVAHLGLAFMFLGIIASSVYDRSDKVILKQGEVTSAVGYDIKFQGPEFLKKSKGIMIDIPLDIKKGETQFSVRPDIYTERRQGKEDKRFSHPYIGRGLVADLYISPLSFDPGTKSSVSVEELLLKKGEPKQFQDYEFTFGGFDIGKMMGKDMRTMSVGANIGVSYKGSYPVVLKPVMNMSSRLGGPESRVKLPGTKQAFLILARINVNEKSVLVVYQGPDVADKGEKAGKGLPSVLVEVSIKPGMTLLWGGCLLILLGGAIAIIRRRPKRLTENSK